MIPDTDTDTCFWMDGYYTTMLLVGLGCMRFGLDLIIPHGSLLFSCWLSRFW
ncbi:hypothetical protein BDW62DRAFT_184734 [Aspergillus aurantiobrunneus]